MTKNISTPPKIEVTYNYGMFKELEGNRHALGLRVEKIKKSINDVGYIPSPIVVNENLQIVDGNGRFEALKSLCLPVYYIVVPGLTIQHCISMNINSTNWNLNDFINSYAEQGNQNYIALRYLAEKHSRLSVRIVCASATNTVGGSDHNTIKKGQLVIEPGAVNEADKTLTWVEDNFYDLKENINGRWETFAQALIFIYRRSEADMGRLVSVVRKYKNDLPPATTIKYTLEQLSKLYNKGMKMNFFYFNAEYDRWCSQNLIAYEQRHGKEKRGRV